MATTGFDSGRHLNNTVRRGSPAGSADLAAANHVTVRLAYQADNRLQTRFTA